MSNRKKTVLLKVLLLGESHVGKTCIFRRYVKDDYTEGYQATIGADFFSKDFKVGDKDVIFQIWDTAGQERYKSLNQTFYRGSDACILVYDICEKRSFDALTDWVGRFMKGVGLTEEAKDSGLIFVVVGNKCDVADGRQVESDVAMEFCAKHGFQFYETSAKTGTNVTEAFEYIGRKGVEKSEAQGTQIKYPDQTQTGINLEDDMNNTGETLGSTGCGC